MSDELYFKVMYERHADGSFQAWAPVLPACKAQGASMTQARDRIMEAIQCYCFNMQKSGASIPQNQPGMPAVLDEVQISLDLG